MCVLYRECLRVRSSRLACTYSACVYMGVFVLSWKRHGPDRAVKLSAAATGEFQTISLLMLRNMLAIPAETENHRIYK